MGNVFVSYSRSDKLLVSALMRELSNSGVPVWIDSENINVGDPWDSTIENAIKDCNQLLLILSENSKNSENVLDEFNLATEFKKKIVIIVVDDVEIPMRMRRIQHIDFRNGYETALEELIQLLLYDLSHQERGSDHTQPIPDVFELLSIPGHDLEIVLPEEKRIRDKDGNLLYPMIQVFSPHTQIRKSWIMRFNSIIIGRHEAADIVVSHPHISRSHLRVFREENNYFLENLSPANGTSRVQPHLELSDNITIQISNGLTFLLANVVYVHFILNTNKDVETRSQKTLSYSSSDWTALLDEIDKDEKNTQ